MLAEQSRVNQQGWRKATYSTGNGACVEISAQGAMVAIRDSVDQSGPIVFCSQIDWRAFISGVQAAGGKVPQ